MDKTDVDLVSLLTESIELQHTFMILQRQITSGLSRVNKVVEMVSKLPTIPSSIYSAGGSRSRNPSQQIVSSRIMEGSGFGVDFDRYMTTQSSINSLSNQASSIQQRSNQITSELLLSCTPSSQRSINHVISPVNTSNNSLVEIQRLSEAIRWDGSDYDKQKQEDDQKQQRSDTTTIEVPFGEMKLIPKPIARTNSKKTKASPLVRQTVLNSVVMGVDSEQSRSSVISFKERVSQVFRSGPRSTVKQLRNSEVGGFSVGAIPSQQPIESHNTPNLSEPHITTKLEAFIKDKAIFAIPESPQPQALSSIFPIQPKHEDLKSSHQKVIASDITPRRHSDDMLPNPRLTSSKSFASPRIPHTDTYRRSSDDTHFPTTRDTKLHNATSQSLTTPTQKPIAPKPQFSSQFSASVYSMRPSILVTSTSSLRASQGPTRGRVLWNRLREAVFESRELVTLLASEENVVKLGGNNGVVKPGVQFAADKKEVVDLKPVVPVAVTVVKEESKSSLFHRLCLHRAFDDKGMYISSIMRHSDTGEPSSFVTDGLHPLSMCGFLVNSLMIVLYVAVLFVSPYKSTFNSISYFSHESRWITALFVLDTLFDMITPLKPKKSDVTSLGKRLSLQDWMKCFIRRYWLIEVVSIIPWIQFVQQDTFAAYPISYLRFLRITRLASKLSNNALFLRIHNAIESVSGIGSILSRILPLVVVFAIFMHIQACTLYYIGFTQGFFKWETQFDHWKYYTGGLDAAGHTERYIWMLTQAVGNTFSTNFKPETNLEQIINIVFIIIGATLYALLVGLLSSAAIAYDSSGRMYRQKIDELTEYLNWKRIDEATKKKVLSYYEFKYRGKYFEEETLLADMNSSLRMELASINCRRLIEQVPFLKRDLKDGRDMIYVGKMATALHAVYYVQGDYVFHQGENATEMFFIQAGTVNIIVNGKIVASATAGSFFGEVALIANIPRTASIQAATSCTLYRLSSKDFALILSEFEDMKERIDLIYFERMEKVRKEKEAKKFNSFLRFCGSALDVGKSQPQMNDSDTSVLLSESLEIQHLLIFLQRQITAGLTRVNKVVDIASKLPSSTPHDGERFPSHATSLKSPEISHAFLNRQSVEEATPFPMARRHLSEDHERLTHMTSSFHSIGHPNGHSLSVTEPFSPLALEIPASTFALPFNYQASSQHSMNLLKNRANNLSNASLENIKRYSTGIRWDENDYERSGETGESKVQMPLTEEVNPTHGSLTRGKKPGFVPLVRRHWTNTVATGSIDSADGMPIARQSSTDFGTKTEVMRISKDSKRKSMDAMTSMFEQSSRKMKTDSMKQDTFSAPALDIEPESPPTLPMTSLIFQKPSNAHRKLNLNSSLQKSTFMHAKDDVSRRHSNDSMPVQANIKPQLALSPKRTPSSRRASNESPSSSSSMVREVEKKTIGASRKNSVTSNHSNFSYRVPIKSYLRGFKKDESEYNLQPKQLQSANQLESMLSNVSKRPSILITTGSEESGEQSRGKTLWKILRFAVLDSRELVNQMKEEAVTSMARKRRFTIKKLSSMREKFDTNATSSVKLPPFPENQPTPETFQHSSALFHKYFLYRAFDDKGEFIPAYMRHTDTFTSVTFENDGLHPMSIFGLVTNTVMIGIVSFKHQ
ncbi:anaphase-promoting complex subunit Hcn1 [Rhizoclosmatium sp. JEL0117]|nr:anaphase-promoting complex subunit Hcn1 [Rhizoclosmatium sp. JEL0117]